MLIKHGLAGTAFVSASASVEFAITDVTTLRTDFSGGVTDTVSIGTADAGRDVIVFSVVGENSGVTSIDIRETNSSGTQFTVMSDGTNTLPVLKASRTNTSGWSLGVSSGTTMDIYRSYDAFVSREYLIVGRLVGGSIQEIDRDSYDNTDTSSNLSTSVTGAVDDIVCAVNCAWDPYNSPLSLTGISSTTDLTGAANLKVEYGTETLTSAGTKTVTEDEDSTWGRQLILVNFR